MITAYMLIQTEVGAATQVSASIRQIVGVLKAEHVAGPYDIIAEVEAASVEQLGRGVIAAVQEVPRITRTTTCTVVEL